MASVDVPFFPHEEKNKSKKQNLKKDVKRRKKNHTKDTNSIEKSAYEHRRWLVVSAS